MSRVDYNISDNTKMFVRYNMQREVQRFPMQVWSSNATQQLPYPSSVLGKNKSDSVTASLTHVFSPSMTNEFVFGYTFIGFPNVFEDLQGGSGQGRLRTRSLQERVAQFRTCGGRSRSIQLRRSGRRPSAGLYANKYMPSVSDIGNKVWGRH
jgi:hypothetical protein